MELKPVSPEIDELRKVIISSNLTTCYLILNRFPSEEDEETNYYEKFRTRWTDLYKDIYKLVSKMKERKPSRRKE